MATYVLGHGGERGPQAQHLVMGRVYRIEIGFFAPMLIHTSTGALFAGTRADDDVAPYGFGYATSMQLRDALVAQQAQPDALLQATPYWLAQACAEEEETAAKARAQDVAHG